MTTSLARAPGRRRWCAAPAPWRMRLLAPVDHQTDVIEVAIRRHAAVGHALGDGARHEALGRPHAHLGAHAMGEPLGHVVGEPPAARLAADERDGPRPLGLDGRLDAPGKLGERVVPGGALEASPNDARPTRLSGYRDAPRIVHDLRGGEPLGAQRAARLAAFRLAVRGEHLAALRVDEHGTGVVAAPADGRDRDRPVGVGHGRSGARRRASASVRPAIGKLEDGLPLFHGNRPSSRRAAPRPGGRTPPWIGDGFPRMIVAGWLAKRNGKSVPPSKRAEIARIE